MCYTTCIKPLLTVSQNNTRKQDKDYPANTAASTPLVLGGIEEGTGWPWDVYAGWQARYLDSLAAGNSLTIALVDADISESTPARAARRDPAFAEACIHARTVGSAYRVDVVEDDVYTHRADSFPDRKLFLQGNCQRYKPAAAQVAVVNVAAPDRVAIDSLTADQLIALQTLAHQRLMAGPGSEPGLPPTNGASIEHASPDSVPKGPTCDASTTSEGSETPRGPSEGMPTHMVTDSQKNSDRV